eukprot:CAMPEP_0183515654 /NCGR_PEP_ID=MMETSP0371-20130417/13665_1 /TAXON_ID=268820 /ORGANISM="Peridinium aciculiferum, Strain PAER-2" /LENGTH=151 /DNA_ID=CAMNT_0025713243 /DNA_START=27 /DNA_END=479 /DNA_ORIENTATION=+
MLAMFVRPPLAARRPAPLVVALVLVLCHHVPGGAAVLAVAAFGAGLRGLSASGQPDEFYFRLRRFGNGSNSLNAGEGKGGVGGGGDHGPNHPTAVSEADAERDLVSDDSPTPPAAGAAAAGDGKPAGGSPSWYPTDLQDADTFGKDYVVDS